LVHFPLKEDYPSYWEKHPWECTKPSKWIAKCNTHQIEEDGGPAEVPAWKALFLTLDVIANHKSKQNLTLFYRAGADPDTKVSGYCHGWMYILSSNKQWRSALSWYGARYVPAE
jgi:hypothetical protein